MKRLLALASTSLLFASVLSLPSSGAQGAKIGSICLKSGIVSKIGNTKVVCVKNGKKLLWIKVSESSKQTSVTPNPSSSPSPTTTPTPSPTPTVKAEIFKASIPISLPVNSIGSITFSNAASNFAQIPQIAWQNVQDVLKRNTPVENVNNDLHIGPNTKIVTVGGLSRVKEILSRTQRLFSGFTQVKNFSLLIYNSKDEPWAEKEWETFAKERNYFKGEIEGEKRRIAGNCQTTVSPGVFSGSVEDCRGADSSAIQNKDDAVLTLGQSNSTDSGDHGEIISHEYVHAVQAGQWIGNPKVYCTEATNSPDCFRSHWVNNTVPCWLNEGSAHAMGHLLSGDSFADYRKLRENLPFNQGPTTVTDYSESSLKSFLFNQEIGDRGCISNGAIYRLGYSVGALTVEILTAIGGPQAVMSIYSLCAEGSDFPTAFQKVYGISWSEASGILAKTLAAEYATYGPPPK